MKTPKVKWLVRELMVKRQCRLLRKWLRYVENLKATEEKMIDHCWPETGKGLDDWDDEEDELGSSEDLIDCQEGSGRFPNCQMGKGTEKRSADDLEDCQGGSGSIEDCQGGSGSVLNCQISRNEHSRLSESLMDSEKSSIQQGVLMKMGSVDLMVCQESSGSIPYYLVGRDE
jgi:hypothetical protein